MMARVKIIIGILTLLAMLAGIGLALSDTQRMGF